MGKQKDVGVFQMDNGAWAYRFKIKVDGQEISRRKTTDEYGGKLRSKGAAIKARERAIIKARTERVRKPMPARRLVREVYEEYSRNGRKDKAYSTIRKQDSLWKNHLKKKFGKRFVDEISSAEVNDYLAQLYYENEYSYQYTESFLKMFYLIFGQAYSRCYLSIDDYNRLCTNKDTKISMPKRKCDDERAIVAFSNEQLEVFDAYFKGKNTETAYLLGRYCGLRINECYGLKWDHVNLEKGTIFIDRQMQYQEGLVKLVPPKTRNAKRTIYLCEFLKEYLQRLKNQRALDAKQLAKVREQKRRIIEDLDGKKIFSTELVNCLYDGTIQTVNSFKYPSREIKARLGIGFKYHYLRHTYGTRMAEQNTPQYLLCNQMGHSNIQVTQRYYIAVSEKGIEALREKLNEL